MHPNLIESYGALAGTEHRRELGQFFTPLNVASFMCQWAIGGGARSLYDPAVGLGAFFFAAKAIDEEVDFYGSEIDPVIFNHFRKAEGARMAGAITNCDYFLSWGATHEAIVCNPPYMRFQHFLGRNKIFDAFWSRIGLRLSGYTNCASAFLLKSLFELRKRGRLAYLMPLEFLNAGYGTLVKSQLLHHDRLKVVIRLQAEKEIFPEAITSLGIVLVSDDGKRQPVRFYSVDCLKDLTTILSSKPIRSVPASGMSASEKWLKYFEDSLEFSDRADLVRVCDYGGFSRGIATGANEFFVMSPSKAQRLQIPASVLSRCIARSSQVKRSVFRDEDLKRLEADDAEVLLFDVDGEASRSILDYIHVGESQCFNARYLTKMRRPWYKIEHREPAPLLFGVFSREAFKVVRNYSSAVNLTCFHGFHPNLFGRSYVDKLFLYFKSQAAHKILALSMRRYGDALDKFEPNDLNNALAPSSYWLDQIADTLVQQGMRACNANDPLPESIESVFRRLLL